MTTFVVLVHPDTPAEVVDWIKATGVEVVLQDRVERLQETIEAHRLETLLTTERRVYCVTQGADLLTPDLHGRTGKRKAQWKEEQRRFKR